MKHISQMIFRWYLAITLLALFGAHTLSFSDVFLGLLLMWILALVFLLGLYSKSQKTLSLSAPSLQKSKDWRILLLIAIITIPLSLFVIRFYTGNTLQGMLTATLQHQSLYSQYQAYFERHELWRLSFYKVPVIFSAMLLKLSVIYTYIRTFVLDRRIALRNLVPLIIITLSYLLFSVARGTTFEVFEIFLLFWFSLTIRAALSRGANHTSRKSNIFIFLVALVSMIIYNYNISARFNFNYTRHCVTAELCKDPNAWIYSISPVLGELSFKLVGYFTFGIYFSSSFISVVWLSSLANILLGIIPFGFIMRGGEIKDQMCGPVIDCAAAWIPDSIVFFPYFGILGLLILVFFLGRVTKILVRSSMVKRKFSTIAVLYFIVLTIFSLPVGNFLFTSSSNILSFLIILSIYLYFKLGFQRAFKKNSRNQTISLAG